MNIYKYIYIYIYIYITPPCRLGPYNMTTSQQKGTSPSPTRPPVGYMRWPLMHKDGILSAEQSLTRQLQLPNDLQNFTLALTERDGRSG